MEVASCIAQLEGKVELLELDYHFCNDQQPNPLIDKIYSIAENFQVIQQLVEAKQQAIQSAREVNAQLREYISLLEISSGTSSLSVATREADEKGEFIIALSETTDWSTVPKYMRGKLTCEKVNEYIASLNAMAAELARIQRTPYNKLSKEQKDCLMEYKNAASYCPNETNDRIFLLEGEVKRFTEKTELVLRGLNAILRHCGRTREIRGGGHNRIIFQ